jgi:hypothetical protein
MYTEIGSNTYYSVNTDNNHNTSDIDDEDPHPVKRRKLFIAPAMTTAICHKHTLELCHRELSPFVALSAIILEIAMCNFRLMIDFHQSSSIVAITMPREYLGVRLRHQRRYYLLSLRNSPSNAFLNTLRSGVRRHITLNSNCY